MGGTLEFSEYTPKFGGLVGLALKVWWFGT